MPVTTAWSDTENGARHATKHLSGSKRMIRIASVRENQRRAMISVVRASGNSDLPESMPSIAFATTPACCSANAPA